MLSLAPLSGAPLSATDDGINVVIVAFDADEITFGTPFLENAPVFEEETIPITELTFTTHVDALDIHVTSNFTADDIVASTPVVAQADWVQDHKLAAALNWGFLPVVEGLPANFTNNFVANDINAVLNISIDIKEWELGAVDTDTFTEVTSTIQTATFVEQGASSFG